MHCDDTEDSEATWVNSWHALEKAYAEGRVNAIGVSNFDAGLLNAFTENKLDGIELNFSVKPHLVQNWGEPGSIDGDVVKWCTDNNAVFQVGSVS